MWLSQGDLGTGVSVGSPVINLDTSGAPGATASNSSGGFDWSTIYTSPYFYAAILIVLFIFSRKK